LQTIINNYIIFPKTIYFCCSEQIAENSGLHGKQSQPNHLSAMRHRLLSPFQKKTGIIPRTNDELQIIDCFAVLSCSEAL